MYIYSILLWCIPNSVVFSDSFIPNSKILPVFDLLTSLFLGQGFPLLEDDEHITLCPKKINLELSRLVINKYK